MSRQLARLTFRAAAICALALGLAGCKNLQDLDRTLSGSLPGGEPTLPANRAPAPATAPQAQPGDADYRQGLRYKEGDGVARDDAAAARFFRRAAEVGHVDARFTLALALQTGRGVPRDEAAALKWYEIAGNAGHREAQFLAGLLYRRGEGTAADPARAAGWFERAAAQGHAGAHYQLGLAYATGDGVAQDRARAVRHFEIAGEAGYPEAAQLLGDIYSNGRGVPVDHAWAARWHGKAAAHGIAPSQYMLGVGFGSGLGLPREPAAAYFWFLLAAEGGADGAAELRDAVAKRLPPDARARIEAQARAWTPATRSVTWDPPTVRFLQVALTDLGYDPGPADGAWGPLTRAALAAYARDAKLGGVGEPNAEVMRSLRADRLRRVGS